MNTRKYTRDINDPIVYCVSTKDDNDRHPFKKMTGKTHGRCRTCFNKKNREVVWKIASYKPAKHCFICGSETKTCYDHDHTTKKFRGWLCNLCNTKLGWFETYKDAILKYLKP